MNLDKEMEKGLNEKYSILRAEISKLDNAVVAFSGGIDSALVLKVAFDILKDKVIAVTADSPSLPRNELDEAKKIACEIGARHEIINTEETKNEEYLKNPGNRCYFCKTELYTKLEIFATTNGFTNILNGTNKDDTSDYRPGLKAADEHKVISPLRDSNLTKSEVRGIAKSLNLTIWEKPSSPCLSSRVPYGQAITMKKLKMIESFTSSQ